MKLKCISKPDEGYGLFGDEYYYKLFRQEKHEYVNLEIGEDYDVKIYKLDHDTIGYLVELNDTIYYYNINRFEKVDVSRDNKIKQLGI